MLRNIYVYIKYITIGNDELNIIKQNLDKEVNLFIPDDIEEIDFEDNTKMKIDGVFIAQGVAGSTDFAKRIGAKVNNDKIVVDENMQTSIKGLFACGDCTGGLYQVSKAVYEGTKAGLAVLK